VIIRPFHGAVHCEYSKPEQRKDRDDRDYDPVQHVAAVLARLSGPDYDDSQ
jgi:hypothetical protein